MATSSTTQPIIIIRKKAAHHGGHHGGAWKVAYADFVTAMMAFFITLWLMASSEQVKKSIAAYFLDPQGTRQELGSGGQNGSGRSMFVSMDDMNQLKKQLEQALKSLPKIEELKNQITMTVTGEGLRVELVENSKGGFFEPGNAKPTPLAIEAMGLLASQLGQLPNSIMIEGHTDATPYGKDESYTNWELSSDRAMEARRLMLGHGLRANQVKQIRGCGDQSLRNLKDPLDPSNRRISVIVMYGDQPAPEAKSEESKKGAEKDGKAEKSGEAKGGEKNKEEVKADGKKNQTKAADTKSGGAKASDKKDAEKSSPAKDHEKH